MQGARGRAFWILSATIIVSPLWILNAFADSLSIGDTAGDPSRGAGSPTVVGIPSRLGPDKGGPVPADDPTLGIPIVAAHVPLPRGAGRARDRVGAAHDPDD